MKQLKKIYLAIPYSGMQQSSFEQATKLTADLMSSFDDINVFSPITHSHPLVKKNKNIGHDWSWWEEIDHQFLDWCDELWVIVPREGISTIHDSKGVQAEITYALTHNKPIFYIPYDIKLFEFKTDYKTFEKQFKS